MRYPLAVVISVVFSLVLIEQSQGNMVYLYQKGEKRQVALASDEGELIRLLTPEDLQTYHPEMSSNGRYVAYSIGTIREDLVDVAVHVKDLETGDVEVWTPSGDQYIHAEFSGDGEYLAYSGPVEKENGEIQQCIHLIDLPDARAQGPVRVEEKNGQTFKYFQPKTKIIGSSYDSFFPALSSDASFVVYHRSKDEDTKELVLYDRAKKSKELLTERGGHSVVPSLSWENRYLTYSSIRDGQWDIHLIDLWNKDDRQITNSPVKEFTPVFAPDGSITYTHIIENDAMQLDLYRINRQQVFDPEAEVSPSPFIADSEVLEYIPAFSGATWFSLQRKPSLPGPPRSSFGAVAYKDKIYVAGGHQGPEHTYPPGSFLDRLDIYDTETQTWSQGASLSVPRHGFEIVAHDGYIYAFGGFAYSDKYSPAWHSLDIIERYDIANDSWEVLPTKLPRRRSSNIAAKVGTKVYLMGGWNSTPQQPGDKQGNFHRKIDVFDLKTLEMTTSPYEVPLPLRRALTAIVHDGEIILLGGITPGEQHFNLLDEVTVFNPQTGQWRDLPSLPFATFAPGTGVYQGKMFLLGGLNKKRRYQNTIYALDLSEPRDWLNTGRYLNENKGFPITVSHPKEGLAILGGHTYRYTSGGKVDTPVSTFEYLK